MIGKREFGIDLLHEWLCWIGGTGPFCEIAVMSCAPLSGGAQMVEEDPVRIPVFSTRLE